MILPQNHDESTPAQSDTGHDSTPQSQEDRYAGTHADPEADGLAMWESLDPKEKLTEILQHFSDPAQWIEIDFLEIFAQFYHEKATWGMIKAKAKEIGASAFDIEEAVKQIVRRQARQQVLEALRNDDPAITPDQVIANFTEAAWLEDTTLQFLARYYDDAPQWLRIKVSAKKAGINPFDLDKAVKQIHARQNALKPPSTNGVMPKPHPILDPNNGPVDWKDKLSVNTRGEPKADIANVGLILAHHPAWTDRFWYDSVEKIAMVEQQKVTDKLVNDIGIWLGEAMRLSCSNHRFLRNCIEAHCQNHPRDLQKEWLESLPPWDQTPRLETWLRDCAGVEDTAYGRHVSACMPVAMVARALNPGVLYRYVVILEGPEEMKKSSLVFALGSERWTVELSLGIDSKEAHLMLKGAWVVELPELDAMSRTEDSRLKAYFSARKDSYIPKYSNDRADEKRRAIFIGTVNEKVYLKGRTGNTRYLPIEVTKPVDIEAFLKDRLQIFSEALEFYANHQADWWQMSFAAEAEAIAQREKRRVPSVYEDALRQWLDEPYTDEFDRLFPRRNETTWAEIAEKFLKIDKGQWKDPNLQSQIASAFRGLGWQDFNDRRSGKKGRGWARII